MKIRKYLFIACKYTHIILPEQDREKPHTKRGCPMMIGHPLLKKYYLNYNLIIAFLSWYEERLYTLLHFP